MKPLSIIGFIVTGPSNYSKSLMKSIRKYMETKNLYRITA